MSDNFLQKTPPLVSIIVPVYNVEPYLKECLKSIAEQTYETLEIICVNDGSTDGSGDLLEAQAKRDARMRVLTQSNQGLAVARNAALDAATGNYVMFVDSDDKIDKETVETVVEALEASEADFVAFGAREWFPEENLTAPFHSFPDSSVISGETILNTSFGTVAWNKCFRTTFLQKHGIRFPVGVYFEDGFFNLVCLSHASKVLTRREVLYSYRMRSGSIMNRAYRREPGMVLHLFRGLAYLQEHWTRTGFMQTHRSLFAQAFEDCLRDGSKYLHPSDQAEYIETARRCAKEWDVALCPFTYTYDFITKGREGNRHVYRIARSIRKRLHRLGLLK